jgi:hypothetical protein
MDTKVLAFQVQSGCLPYWHAGRLVSIQKLASKTRAKIGEILGFITHF